MSPDNWISGLLNQRCFGTSFENLVIFGKSCKYTKRVNEPTSCTNHVFGCCGHYSTSLSDESGNFNLNITHVSQAKKLAEDGLG